MGDAGHGAQAGVRALRLLVIAVIAFLVVVGSSGCASQPTGAAAVTIETPAPQAAVTPSPSSTATPSPSPSPTSTATPSPTPPPPTATPLPGLPARVVNVLDGETLDVDFGDRLDRVRLMGIDAPAIAAPFQPAECFGNEAAAHMLKLVEGKTVQVAADFVNNLRDAAQRLYAYVWLPDGRMLNGVMIADGYAYAQAERIQHRFLADFQVVERQARAQGRGLWSPRTCNGQRQTTTPQPPQPVPSPANATPKPAGS